MTDTTTGDTAMERKLFINMTTAEQDAFIASLGDRRLAPVRLYKESLAKKQAIRSQRTLDLINKQSAMMEKELLALDKALSKLEQRAITIAALCNQVELNV